jgi:Na+-driven multidrug efflux pump
VLQLRPIRATRDALPTRQPHHPPHPQVRSLGIPAALLSFVANGVFRGFKDTRTPLLGAVVSAAASLGLNVLFLYVLRLGVPGAAAATTVAQVVACGLLMAALFRGGKVQARKRDGRDAALGAEC